MLVGVKLMAPVMPGKPLVVSNAFLIAWASVEPARVKASTNR